MKVRLTLDPAEDVHPEWLPDGKRIAFSSSAKGSSDILLQMADGSGEPAAILNGPENELSGAWSPNGKIYLYVRQAPRTASADRRGGYDVAGNVLRFLLVEPVGDAQPAPAVHVIENWIGAAGVRETGN